MIKLSVIRELKDVFGDFPKDLLEDYPDVVEMLLEDKEVFNAILEKFEDESEFIEFVREMNGYFDLEHISVKNHIKETLKEFDYTEDFVDFLNIVLEDESIESEIIEYIGYYKSNLVEAYFEYKDNNYYIFYDYYDIGYDHYHSCYGKLDDWIERYFDYAKLGEDLCGGDGYHELSNGKILYFYNF